MAQPQIGRPGIESLHHVAITVHDLSAAVAFYSEILGLAELEAPAAALENGIRWFDLGNGRALHLVRTDEAVSGGRAHFAITVDDIKGWRAFVEERGIEVQAPRLELYGAERFFMRDPSGNLLELVKWLD